ncbi:hypothetical protein [Mesorhizobium sp. SARCC-RB16n]|uniref:hypothetical protein n=1 Tax=Mesorhizobium sp. SARCC-RB16n TaxID=2116687 RepID=UPI00122FA41E|nr:hypothetical protein [Mesorhizobium sp. SARCC-RB16n]
MELDRSLTDDEMEARFLHNVVLFHDDINPGTPLDETNRDTSGDVDPVVAALDNIDGPFTDAEIGCRVKLKEINGCLAAPAAAYHFDMTPQVEQTAAEKRLATINKMASRYQRSGAAWQDDERSPPSDAWEKARSQRLARKAEQRRARYAAKLDREEAEGRPVRRHRSLAGMSPEERKARKAEQDKQAQRRRRSKKALIAVTQARGTLLPE